MEKVNPMQFLAGSRCLHSMAYRQPKKALFRVVSAVLLVRLGSVAPAQLGALVDLRNVARS